MRLALLSIALCGGLHAAVAAATAPPPDAPALVEAGRILYQQGLKTDGAPLSANGAAGLVLKGEAAACGRCHRRSGMGSHEGEMQVPPVSGPLLFSRPSTLRPVRPGRSAPEIAPTRQESRPAYDDASLARALREGIDPLGRPLAALMPRYALDEPALAAITAYLHRLSAEPAPGVTADALHLATVITPEADPARARLLTQALAAWARGGAPGGRPIALQVWTLAGPPETWGPQLAQRYQAEPVFALVSGLGGAHWRPVGDFCEHEGLPCLFPMPDDADIDEGSHWTLWLTPGVALEARLIAPALAATRQAGGRVVQLADGAAGESAAAQLTALLQGQPGLRSELRRVESAGPLPPLDDLGPADRLVGWIGADTLARLIAAHPQGPGTDAGAGAGAGAVILSAQLGDPQRCTLPEAWQARTRWVSVRADPARRHGTALLGLLPWAQRLGLPVTAETEALHADVYLAAYYFNDALARMRGPLVREYLLESIESASFTRPVAGAYDALSLGPGQRIAARGGRLLACGGSGGRDLLPVGPPLAP